MFTSPDSTVSTCRSHCATAGCFPAKSCDGDEARINRVAGTRTIDEDFLLAFMTVLLLLSFRLISDFGHLCAADFQLSLQDLRFSLVQLKNCAVKASIRIPVFHGNDFVFLVCKKGDHPTPAV